MRRTIEEAARLLAIISTPETDGDVEHCLWELSEIVSTIEAMQFAVREAGNIQGLS